MDYLKENHVTFPNALDSSTEALQAMMRYETLPGLGAVPFTYVIGRDGKIIDVWYDYDPARTEKALKKLGF